MDRVRLLLNIDSTKEEDIEKQTKTKSGSKSKSKSKEISAIEASELSERNTLKLKAKQYGIKSNLSTNDLRSTINLYESGHPEKIPKSHIKKGNEGKFVLTPKKAAAGGFGTVIIIIIILVILMSSKKSNESS